MRRPERLTSWLGERRAISPKENSPSELGVSVWALRAWRRKGYGPQSVKIGSAGTSMPADAVDQFLANPKQFTARAMTRVLSSAEFSLVGEVLVGD